ncbi:unnamed protein product [Didymodactylos carnosus]|uniref:Uncharacterized protein n=1 Tax=Didymodactylos carnosus TaxID=1234261 RepID=A0A8S2VFU2_9BILA|nr:unnamed protein product [Didymodactylos carnosus]
MRPEGHPKPPNASSGTLKYNGEDLLLTRGRDIYDFSRLTVQKLYRAKELNDSILPPGAAHLVRASLDGKRFEKFHDAVRAKYCISSLLYDQCYSKLIRRRNHRKSFFL